MGDEGVRRELWDGKIPVCFKLDEDEVTMSIRGDRVAPQPCYMMIPRVSYLPLVYEKLDKLYSRAAGRQVEDEVWVSAEATPLKWHYPVGVLYDLYGRGQNLPWEITVHFRNFPEDILLHCESKEAVEAHFKSKLKERVCYQQLLFKYNYDEFWAVNKKMMLSTRSEHEPFRSIPFCIYQACCTDGKILFQRLLPPHRPKASPDDQIVENTLEDIIKLYSASFPLTEDY
ncbi:Autophagy protein 5 [Geodia barretti]|uniref:Autophagy protein 5 n=1 Tax=Geodia barretti TaxID=519541 RepID=A0AA35XFN7_GEOBA|nr:Autophagy protein 5 [Geodia barretti]